MITPPIIINQKGDIELFENVSDAEVALEPIDVENKEFTVFDSTGLVLTPTVSDDRIHVRLMESSPPEFRPGELESELRELLSRLGEDRTLLPDDEVRRLPLPELIKQLDAFQKRARQRRGFWFWKRRD